MNEGRNETKLKLSLYGCNLTRNIVREST